MKEEQGTGVDSMTVETWARRQVHTFKYALLPDHDILKNIKV